jgi:hypothetical protein
MRWKKRYNELAEENNELMERLEQYEAPPVEMIALVDMYADGQVLRQGHGRIWSDDPVYRNAPHMFREVTEDDG